jgi:hypothetical protein
MGPPIAGAPMTGAPITGAPITGAPQQLDTTTGQAGQ